MQEVGHVELDYMKSLTGETEENLIDRIFYDFQKKEYQIAEEYLSGDIRAKIEDTEQKIEQIEVEMNKKYAMAILHIEEPTVYKMSPHS